MKGVIQQFLFTSEELAACTPQAAKPAEVKKADYKKLRFFDFPKNDNETLFNFQYLFLKTNDNKYYWELWLLVATVAERLIKNEMLKKGFSLAPDDLEEKKSMTCEYLLRRYKTRNGYYIKDNYISAIKDSVRHALYYRTEIERITGSIEDIKGV